MAAEQNTVEKIAYIEKHLFGGDKLAMRARMHALRCTEDNTIVKAQMEVIDQLYQEALTKVKEK